MTAYRGQRASNYWIPYIAFLLSRPSNSSLSAVSYGSVRPWRFALIQADRGGPFVSGGYVYGVVSVPPFTCSTTEPSYLTHVASYLHWIEEHMNRTVNMWWKRCSSGWDVNLEGCVELAVLSTWLRLQASELIEKSWDFTNYPASISHDSFFASSQLAL